MLVPDEPRTELTTERTRGQRRAAFAAVAVVAVVVGALVWKPWDAPSGAPLGSARPTIPAVAVATPEASVRATPPGTPIRTPLPIPETPAPQSPDNGRVIFPTQNALGSLVFFPGYGPGVYCIYSARNTSRPLMKSMVVEAPLVMPNLDAPVGRVRMHVELERNSEDKIFESDWQPVSKSSTQVTRANGSWPFDSVLIKVPRAPGVTLYRATIVVDWLDVRGRVLETQSIRPTSYGPLGDADFPVTDGGCAAAI